MGTIRCAAARSTEDTIRGRPGGAKIAVEGLYQFSLQLMGGRLLMVHCLVFDGCDDEFLLGSDFAKANNAVMDYRRESLT